ncbi:MAG: hypothetical protein PHU40_07145 [Sulfurimonas sp.]|nr:hypothetical protein [Sulfurimonas sp.]
MDQKKLKSSLLALSMATVLGMVGCSSSDDAAVAADAAVSGTDVTVERGAVMNASVFDAAGQYATIKNKNVYYFADAITYPITVTGGWIDVNGNGVRDLNDVDLGMTMKSYIPVVTPLTTMASNDGDTNATNFEAKLQLIADMSGLTLADMKKLPSQSIDVARVATAIYMETMQNTDRNTSDFADVNSSMELLRGLDFNSSEVMEAWAISDYLNLGLPSADELEASNLATALEITPAFATFTVGGAKTATLSYSNLNDANITDIRIYNINNSDSDNYRRFEIRNGNDYNLTTQEFTINMPFDTQSGYHALEVTFTIDDNGTNRYIDKVLPVKINTANGFTDMTVQGENIDNDTGWFIFNSDGSSIVGIEYEGVFSGTYKVNSQNNVTVTYDTNRTASNYILPKVIEIDSVFTADDVNYTIDNIKTTSFVSYQEEFTGFSPPPSGLELTFKDGATFFMRKVQSYSGLCSMRIDGNTTTDCTYSSNDNGMTYQFDMTLNDVNRTYVIPFTASPKKSVGDSIGIIEVGEEGNTTRNYKLTAMSFPPVV